MTNTYRTATGIYLSRRVRPPRLKASVYPVYTVNYRIYGACYLSTIEFQIVDFAL